MARYSCREQKTSTTRSMARAGDVIENPFSGERIRFGETSAETGGEYLAGDVLLKYDTRFEKKRHGTETVVPELDDDGAWRVSGYFVK